MICLSNERIILNDYGLFISIHSYLDAHSWTYASFSYKIIITKSLVNNNNNFIQIYLMIYDDLMVCFLYSLCISSFQLHPSSLERSPRTRRRRAGTAATTTPTTTTTTRTATRTTTTRVRRTSRRIPPLHTGCLRRHRNWLGRNLLFR